MMIICFLLITFGELYIENSVLMQLIKFSCQTVASKCLVHDAKRLQIGEKKVFIRVAYSKEV